MPCWTLPQELIVATSESVGQSDGLCLDPSRMGKTHKTASTGFICGQVQVGMHRYLPWAMKVGFMEFTLKGVILWIMAHFRSLWWFKTFTAASQVSTGESTINHQKGQIPSSHL